MSTRFTRDDVLTSGELAARLGLSIHALQRWRLRGMGPKFTKIRPTFGVYFLEDVEEWERAKAARDRSD